MNIMIFQCCSHRGLHCAAKGLERKAKQWLLEAYLPWDIWWWEVVCKFSSAPRDTCQALWPSSTLSCSSRPSIQVDNIREETQKSLWNPIWASGGSGLRQHLYKSDLNRISNHLAVRFGSDLQKFLLSRLPEVNLDTIWICQKSNLVWQSEQGLQDKALSQGKRKGLTIPLSWKCLWLTHMWCEEWQGVRCTRPHEVE